MGMSAAIFGAGFWCRRRRKRKRRERESTTSADSEEGNEKGSGDDKGEEMDPAEMETVNRGHGKAELGVESQKVELDASSQKVELDAASQQMTHVRLAELEEKPAMRYELAG
ncbi:hypothetical protein BJX64DRAFT_246178 [Aspergillus heterothallicus]